MGEVWLDPAKYEQPVLTDADLKRFWSRVDRTGDCWIWQERSGPARKYGYFSTKRLGPQSAHRVAFLIHHGHWPNVCRHTCDNPACVNPSHLLDGTARDNVHDCVSRGRHVAWKARVTHCPSGHPYDDENTRMYEGRRYCRACMAIVNAKRQEAKINARHMA